MRSKTRTRKRRGGMDAEVPPPYSPPRSPPPVYRRTPPTPAAPQGYGAQFATSEEERKPSQLTPEQWSAIQGRARDITFEIREPTRIVFDSGLPVNNMAKIKLGLPMVAVASVTPLIPKINDKVVAIDKRNNSIKYLLGTVVSRTKPQGQPVTQGFTLKIRTPESEDLRGGLRPFFLNLNSSNFDIVVINEQGGGRKKYKTSKRKTKKHKGSKKTRRRRG